MGVFAGVSEAESGSPAMAGEKVLEDTPVLRMFPDGLRGAVAVVGAVDDGDADAVAPDPGQTEAVGVGEEPAAVAKRDGSHVAVVAEPAAEESFLHREVFLVPPFQEPAEAEHVGAEPGTGLHQVVEVADERGDGRFDGFRDAGRGFEVFVIHGLCISGRPSRLEARNHVSGRKSNSSRAKYIGEIRKC